MKFIFATTVFACYTAFAAAQLPKGVPENGEVIITQPDQTIKAGILTKKKTVKALAELTYHWYASNQVRTTQGGYDGKLLHGKYSAFYLNKNLKEQGLFKHGLKNGTFTCWNESGKISSAACWKNGLMNGPCLSYDKEGVLVKKEHYKNGLLHGKQFAYAGGKEICTRYKKGKEVIKPAKDASSVKPSFFSKVRNAFRFKKRQKGT